VATVTSEPAESDQAILDQALVAFADTAAESPDGLSNHGPMAVEALFTLGRADAIPGFALAYLPELQRSPIVPVMGSGDPEALVGHPDAFPELRGVIARDLAIGCASEGSYEPPVRAWVARLASDPFAAAGHGLIRTFHAWRSAFRCSSDAAIDELATALTYWAATWKPIVLDPPGSGPADRPPLEVLAALPRVPDSARSGPILGIVDAALALDGLAEDIGRASLPTGHDAAFDLLVQAGARLFLADGGRHPHAIAHAVTLPAAARELSALLDDDATDALVRRTWVAVALLASTVGSGIADGVPTVTGSLSEQVSSAVETGDAHAIKLAEACVREAARQPDATDLLTATCAAGADHLGDF
jgi:hypothetical protein